MIILNCIFSYFVLAVLKKKKTSLLTATFLPCFLNHTLHSAAQTFKLKKEVALLYAKKKKIWIRTAVFTLINFFFFFIIAQITLTKDATINATKNYGRCKFTNAHSDTNTREQTTNKHLKAKKKREREK